MKRRKKILLPVAVTLAFILMLIPAAVSAQAPSAAVLEEMRKLDFLIGEWKGKGSMFRLDGKRGAEISQSTKVKKGSDGAKLSISEKKKYPDLRLPSGLPSPMIMNYPMETSVPVTVYYDEAAKLYYWRIETSNGRKQPFPATLVDARTLKIRMEFSGSLTETTIHVTDNGEWHERFDVWHGDKDGWFKSQETVLKKVK